MPRDIHEYGLTKLLPNTNPRGQPNHPSPTTAGSLPTERCQETGPFFAKGFWHGFDWGSPGNVNPRPPWSLVNTACSTPNALCPGDGLRKYIPCANCSDRSGDRRHSSVPTLRRPPACNNLPAGSWRRRTWDAPSCRRRSSAVAIMTDRSISSCRSASAHLSCVQTVVYQQASRPFLKLDLPTSGCIFHFTSRRGGKAPL